MGTRVLRITTDLLVGILGGLRSGPPRYFEVTQDAVPEDARVVALSANERDDCVDITLVSSRWADGTTGELRPACRAVFTDDWSLPLALRRDAQHTDSPSTN